MLGHGADERDYTIAAMILNDLDVSSVRLLTNNPDKIENLDDHGIEITDREPLLPHVNRHNADYLQTKVTRMRHLLDLGSTNGHSRGNAHANSLRSLKVQAERHYEENDTPFVTLTYAQSLDGSIASESGTPLSISGERSMNLTHQLRALHDGILVGIGTVLADDPRLNVRRKEGDHPVPIVLDSSLRFPLDARLFDCDGPDPLIFTGPEAGPDRRDALESKGATVVELPCEPGGGVCLDSLLDDLSQRGVSSVMVEGGSEVLAAFLQQQRVQRIIVTIAPMFIGGQSALDADVSVSTSDAGATDAQTVFPRLENVQQRWYGEDLILEGDPVWPPSE